MSRMRKAKSVNLSEYIIANGTAPIKIVFMVTSSLQNDVIYFSGFFFHANNVGLCAMEKVEDGSKHYNFFSRECVKYASFL